tara:strand:- start:33 stop:209 length:177 start_codon:yes stop_codon:yes gene_type:complete
MDVFDLTRKNCVGFIAKNVISYSSEGLKKIVKNFILPKSLLGINSFPSFYFLRKKKNH